MKKLLAVVMAAGLSIGGAAFAQAAKPAQPGQEYGMCTAFFNGKKEGHEKQKNREGGTYPGPFEALVNDAPDGSDENDTGGDIADLYDWCQQYGIGGNPDENGRFTTCWTDDDQDPDTHNCDD